jgi:hypothetical protein
MNSRGEAGTGDSDNTGDYRQTVLLRVHQLLKFGYERLDRSRYRAAQEEEISGDLADAMELVMDDASSPQWVDSFHIHNERPVADPRRKGKRRRRVDIRIDSAIRRPRTRFAFEAKRLGDGHGVPEYLGKKGLGRFLRGEYARSDDMAGMLGYVQSGAAGEWAASIGRVFSESPEDYCVVQDSKWRQAFLVDGMDHTYCSDHRRQTVGTPIAIYHTLLDFL